MVAPSSASAPRLVLPLATKEPDVLTLDAVADAPHILIVGESGSGKSTLIRHLLDYRPGAAIIADPHGQPDKWPVPCYGDGQDWDAIVLLLTHFQAQMGARYATGQTAPRITLVLDELRGLIQHAPEAIPLIRDILARGRAAGVGLVCVAHDDTAAAVGLTDEYNLIQCYGYRVYLGALARAHAPQLATGEHPRVAYDTATNRWCPLKDDDDAH